MKFSRGEISLVPQAKRPVCLSLVYTKDNSPSWMPSWIVQPRVPTGFDLRPRLFQQRWRDAWCVRLTTDSLCPELAECVIARAEGRLKGTKTHTFSKILTEISLVYILRVKDRPLKPVSSTFSCYVQLYANCIQYVKGRLLCLLWPRFSSNFIFSVRCQVCNSAIAYLYVTPSITIFPWRTLKRTQDRDTRLYQPYTHMYSTKSESYIGYSLENLY